MASDSFWSNANSHSNVSSKKISTVSSTSSVKMVSPISETINSTSDWRTIHFLDLTKSALTSCSREWGCGSWSRCHSTSCHISWIRSIPLGATWLFILTWDIPEKHPKYFSHTSLKAALAQSKRSFWSCWGRLENNSTSSNNDESRISCIEIHLKRNSSQFKPEPSSTASTYSNADSSSSREILVQTPWSLAKDCSSKWIWRGWISLTTKYNRRLYFQYER